MASNNKEKTKSRLELFRTLVQNRYFSEDDSIPAYLSDDKQSSPSYEVSDSLVQDTALGMAIGVSLLFLLRNSITALSNTHFLLAFGVTLTALAVAFSLRLGLTAKVGAVTLLLNYSLGLLTCIVIDGGLSAPIAALLPTVPLYAALLFGHTTAWLSVVFLSLFCLVMPSAAIESMRPTTAELGIEQWEMARGLALVWSSTVILLAAWAYDRRFSSLVSALRKRAFEDALTGVGNRHALEASLRHTSQQRIKKPDSPLSIIIFDIDHFKSINDARGHQAGDEILAEVAKITRSSATRTGDFVVRYGGDEFIVIMPETQSCDALRVALRIQSAVAAAAINCPATTCKNTSVAINNHITLSIGVATTKQDESCNLGKALLERADAALYQAKRNGRNNIVAAQFAESYATVHNAQQPEFAAFDSHDALAASSPTLQKA